MTEQEHTDRCNSLIPEIVKAFPQWDFLIHTPEEEWTVANICNAKPGEVDGLMRYIITEIVEGSEGYSKEEFRDRCVGLVETAIGDLQAVSDAIGNWEGSQPR